MQKAVSLMVALLVVTGTSMEAMSQPAKVQPPKIGGLGILGPAVPGTEAGFGFSYPSLEGSDDDLMFLLGGGVRGRVSRTVTLGAQLAMVAILPEEGSNEAVFGNPALTADVALDDTLNRTLTLGFTVWLPFLRTFDGFPEFITDLAGLTATLYNPGYFMPQTMTLRSDFRSVFRFQTVELNLEAGLDVMLPISADSLLKIQNYDVIIEFERDDEVEVDMHMGVLAVISPQTLVSGYAQMTIVKGLTDGSLVSNDNDTQANAVFGISARPSGTPFCLGVDVGFPLTEPADDLFDYVFTLRLLGAF